MNEHNDKLSDFVEKIDYLVLQHVNYLNNLEAAIKQRVPFAHKKPTECNFGKLFYSQIWPNKESYPDVLKKKIEEIEEEHRIFHNTAALVNPENPENQAVDAVGACKLILKLYSLERELKSK